MENIKEYDYGLFKIEVCRNCFSYRFSHNPNKIFHLIEAENLKNQTPNILVPKGSSEIPNYYKYFKEKYIHLGPLEMCDLVRESNDNNWICFVFNIEKIKKAYSNIKYVDHEAWLILGFSYPEIPLEKENLETKLFRDSYSIKPITEVLLKKLDTKLADGAIIGNLKNGQLARKFSRKNLELMFFKEGSQLFENHINKLHERCNCGLAVME